MEELLKKARELNVDVDGMGKKDMKKELIRSIQIAEGNFPCYATAEEACDQADCVWRADCLKRE
jgi:hypothetical protein